LCVCVAFCFVLFRHNLIRGLLDYYIGEGKGGAQ
jgi:hypothetical protein